MHSKALSGLQYAEIDDLLGLRPSQALCLLNRYEPCTVSISYFWSESKTSWCALSQTAQIHDQGQSSMVLALIAAKLVVIIEDVLLYSTFV